MDFFTKKTSSKMLVGLKLGDDVSQLSYTSVKQSMPDTFSSSETEEDFDIPTLLYKRPGVNQWFFGRDAKRFCQNGTTHAGTKVENLLTLAEAGVPVKIEEKTYDPRDLLVLYIKRTLSLVASEESGAEIVGLMITLEKMDTNTINLMRVLIPKLGMGEGVVRFQSYDESFFQYVVHQPEDIWNSQVIACDFIRGSLHIYQLDIGRKKKPITAVAGARYYPEVMSEKEGEELDELFMNSVREVCSEKSVSCSYLLGDVFMRDWCKDSLKYLLSGGRRVFKGNNLYSKGACYSAMEFYGGKNEAVFIGKNTLKNQVGVKVFSDEQEQYLPLLEAGVDWYEANAQADLILDSGNEIELVLKPVLGNGETLARIILPGLPIRPSKRTRLRLQLSMDSGDLLKILIEDMGFGDFYSASYIRWEEEINLG